MLTGKFHGVPSSERRTRLRNQPYPPGGATIPSDRAWSTSTVRRRHGADSGSTISGKRRCQISLWVTRAHHPQLSPAPASASHGRLPAGTLPRSLQRLEPRLPPGQRQTSTGYTSELASPSPALVDGQAVLPAATA